MKRPIAIVFNIDTDKIPDYAVVLPDLLSEGIENLINKDHPGAADTMQLRCFQFQPK